MRRKTIAEKIETCRCDEEREALLEGIRGQGIEITREHLEAVARNKIILARGKT